MLVQPYGNRQSLISYWEHSTAGQRLGAAFFTDLTEVLVKDGISIGAGGAIIIPRACRMTRFAIRIIHGSPAGGQLVTLGVSINTNCGVFFSNTVIATFNLPVDVDSPGCFNDKISFCFDAGDAWFPTVLIGSGGIRTFTLRFIFGFELR